MNYKMNKILFSVFSLFALAACSQESEESGSSYDFEAAATAKLSLKVLDTLLYQNRSLSPGRAQGDAAFNLLASTAPSLCTSVVCFTPSQLTGKYFGTGLLIQSGGNGMVAYFGQDAWSGITGESEAFEFDAANPIENSGNLTCCNGQGDLSTPNNSYISDVNYLFGYLDATFAVSGVTGNTAMNTTYTLRFVMATGAVTGGVRGDVLMRVDGGGASCPVTNTGCTGSFKWMDSTNENFSTTRPASPVVMNASVVDWVNPFGTDQGNQEIPVLGVPVFPESGEGVLVITETELKATGSTYGFQFDPNSFVMFPTVLQADINSISSKKALMEKVHLAGLPHSAQSMGVGNPASTVLVITPADTAE
jgi:hypothetical protein